MILEKEVLLEVRGMLISYIVHVPLVFTILRSFSLYYMTS